MKESKKCEADLRHAVLVTSHKIERVFNVVVTQRRQQRCVEIDCTCVHLQPSSDVIARVRQWRVAVSVERREREAQALRKAGESNHLCRFPLATHSREELQNGNHVGRIVLLLE